MSDDYSKIIKKDITIIAEKVREEIKLQLENANNKKSRDLISILKYSALAPGKMIRSYLVYNFAKIAKSTEKQFLIISSAIEIIHTYSLIHDDLPAMDNSKKRRGKDSCHIKYGEDMAILAGDALQTLAFKILANNLLAKDANKIIELINIMADFIGCNGMVLGQYFDIMKNDKTEEEIKRTEQLKTGKLIELSCISPFIIADNYNENEYLAAKNYGTIIGMAYQIKDDLLDIDGKKSNIGKDIRQDINNNKFNLVNLIGKDKAQKKLLELTDEAKTHLNIFSDKAIKLKKFTDYLAYRNN